MSPPKTAKLSKLAKQFIPTVKKKLRTPRVGTTTTKITVIPSPLNTGNHKINSNRNQCSIMYEYPSVTGSTKCWHWIAGTHFVFLKF